MKLGNLKLDEEDSKKIIDELINPPEFTEEQKEFLRRILRKVEKKQDKTSI